MYTRAQLEASAANKEDFFARRRAENEARPEGLPPSQGGKYVGFGSGPAPSQRVNQQNDYLSVVSQVTMGTVYFFNGKLSVNNINIYR